MGISIFGCGHRCLRLLYAGTAVEVCGRSGQGGRVSLTKKTAEPVRTIRPSRCPFQLSSLSPLCCLYMSFHGYHSLIDILRRVQPATTRAVVPQHSTEAVPIFPIHRTSGSGLLPSVWQMGSGARIRVRRLPCRRRRRTGKESRRPTRYGRDQGKRRRIGPEKLPPA